MDRASIKSYQLTRPSQRPSSYTLTHTIRLRQDNRNYFMVLLQKDTGRDLIDDHVYLGWMTAGQIIAEAKQFLKDWDWVRFTKISEQDWLEMMRKDGN